MRPLTGSLGTGRLLRHAGASPHSTHSRPPRKQSRSYRGAADACRGSAGPKPRGLGVSTAHRSSSGSSAETCFVRSPPPRSILEGFPETSKESHVPESAKWGVHTFLPSRSELRAPRTPASSVRRVQSALCLCTAGRHALEVTRGWHVARHRHPLLESLSDVTGLTLTPPASRCKAHLTTPLRGSAQ